MTLKSGIQPESLAEASVMLAEKDAQIADLQAQVDAVANKYAASLPGRPMQFRCNADGVAGNCVDDEVQYWKTMKADVSRLMENISLGNWTIETLEPTVEQWAAYREGRLQFVNHEPVILPPIALPEGVVPRG